MAVFHGFIETQFHHLVRTIPASGRIIRPVASAALDRVIARGCWTPIDTFGPNGHWRAEPETADGRQCRIVLDGAPQGLLDWSLAGIHNQANALAAIAAARHAGIPPQDSIGALNAFQGVRRRLELRGTVGGVAVYDDFAHHPTAIATTLDGLRRRVGREARILAVIEPRSNTMKLGTMAAQLPAALAEADLTFCYGAAEGKQALGWNPAEVLAPLGERLWAGSDLQALAQAVCDAARPGDHILVMSNGSFGGIHQTLLDGLAHRPLRAAH
ncbi:UDP-N-acetylmuramate--L-alanyl-gamma-D-glutamyl-meso-2,6-diaminoheptandioate ligase OS=Castellaniella defragrans OX=75697 GN=mpl PE=3 SV=1 [Castellaniella defragrans]